MIFQQDFSQDVVVTVLVPRASDLAHIVWRAGDSLQCWLARTGLAWPGQITVTSPGPAQVHQQASTSPSSQQPGVRRD